MVYNQSFELVELMHYCLLSQLRIAFCKLDSENELEVLRMTYANNYRNDNHNMKWIIAVYIKKHFSLALGNALMNAWC